MSFVNKMESCLAVEKEVERVLTSFASIKDHNKRSLEDLINHVIGLKNELELSLSDQHITPTHSIILTQCLKKIRDTINQVSSQHKDIHGRVSKVGKSVDKNFVSDFSSVSMVGSFETEERRPLVNNVIYEHFLRQGMLDIAEQLIQESGVDVEPEQKRPFLELHRILGALKQHNIEPALQWAQENRAKLSSQHSSLEFKLHRLHFIDLVKQGAHKQLEALNYARQFAAFASSHQTELQVLMGSLLFLRQGIENSPYASLLDPIHWEEIGDIFTKDACTLLGLSVESPLSVVVKAGCAALPPLLNIKQVMQQRQCTGVWAAKDELPVEISLGDDCQYHSIFACPILRQQSTNSNHPVRLVCGHCISKDALTKLATANKVKCPYCPMEMSQADARQIYF